MFASEQQVEGFLAQVVDLVPSSQGSLEISQGRVVTCNFWKMTSQGNILVSGTLIDHLDFYLKFFLTFSLGILVDGFICVLIANGSGGQEAF